MKLKDFEVYDIHPALYVGYKGEEKLNCTNYSHDFLNDMIKFSNTARDMVFEISISVNVKDSSVHLRCTDYMVKMGYKSDVSFYNALCELLDAELLYRTKYRDVYWVNSFMLNRDARL